MKRMLFAMAMVASTGLTAAGANDHFECHAVQFYERLNVEVQQTATAVRVRLFSFDAGRAAQQLGLVPANGYADALIVDLPTAWCHSSPDKLGVVQCELPNWRWPRPTVTATALDRKGTVLGRGELSVYRLD